MTAAPEEPLWGGSPCNSRAPATRKRKWNPWKDSPSKRQNRAQPSEDGVPRTKENPFGFKFTQSGPINIPTPQTMEEIERTQAFIGQKAELDFVEGSFDRMAAVGRWVDDHIELRERHEVFGEDTFLGAAELLNPRLWNLVERDALKDDDDQSSVKAWSTSGDIMPEREQRPPVRWETPRHRGYIIQRWESKAPPQLRVTKEVRVNAYRSEKLGMIYRPYPTENWTPEEENDFEQAEQEREVQRYLGVLNLIDPWLSGLDYSPCFPSMIQRTKKFLDEINQIRKDEEGVKRSKKFDCRRVSRGDMRRTVVEKEADCFLASLEKEGVVP